VLPQCALSQVAAEKGFEVTAVELEPRFLDSGMKRIADSVHKMASKAAAKGKMTEAEAKEHAEKTLSRITPSTDRSALGECDLIIEAVIEDLSLKKPLYEEIGRLASDTTVIASYTSSLSITEMGQFSGRPSQTVGLHFFNPVQLMALVEVVKTDFTCVSARPPLCQEPPSAAHLTEHRPRCPLFTPTPLSAAPPMPLVWRWISPAPSGRRPSNASTRRASLSTGSWSRTSAKPSGAQAPIACTPRLEVDGARRLADCWPCRISARADPSLRSGFCSPARY
jgi:hypothetical protein